MNRTKDLFQNHLISSYLLNSFWKVGKFPALHHFPKLVNYEFSKKFETTEIHTFPVTLKFLKEWERS